MPLDTILKIIIKELQKELQITYKYSICKPGHLHMLYAIKKGEFTGTFYYSHQLAEIYYPQNKNTQYLLSINYNTNEYYLMVKPEKIFKYPYIYNINIKDPNYLNQIIELICKTYY